MRTDHTYARLRRRNDPAETIIGYVVLVVVAAVIAKVLPSPQGDLVGVALVCAGLAPRVYVWLDTKAPRHLRRRRPELVPFYEVLSGRRTYFDDVMLQLGLFSTHNEFTIRPRITATGYSDYWDWVQFEPVPGTRENWEPAMPQVNRMFRRPFILSSDTDDTLNVEFEHKEFPAAPKDIVDR